LKTKNTVSVFKKQLTRVKEYEIKLPNITVTSANLLYRQVSPTNNFTSTEQKVNEYSFDSPCVTQTIKLQCLCLFKAETVLFVCSWSTCH